MCIRFYKTTYPQSVENSWGYKPEGMKFELSGHAEEMLKKNAGVQPVLLPCIF